MIKNKDVHYCDFCEKTSSQVEHMVMGMNNVCICNRCIVVSAAICMGIGDKSAVFEAIANASSAEGSESNG